jgi:hypothetical protein
MKFNKLTALLFCLVICNILSAQSFRPKVVVDPSDNFLISNGYYVEIEYSGTKKKIPDLRKAYENSTEIAVALNVLNSLLSDRGFFTLSIENFWKAQKDADDYAKNPKDGNVLANLISEFTKIKNDIKNADLKIKISWSKNLVGNKYSIRYDIYALDRYTDKQLAGIGGTSAPSFDSDFNKLFRDAIAPKIDELTTQINNSYNEMINNDGREISFIVKLSDNIGEGLRTEFNGLTLDRIIENWVAVNTVKGRYSTIESDNNHIEFSQVHIPFYDKRNNPNTPEEFLRGLRKELKGPSYNITSHQESWIKEELLIDEIPQKPKAPPALEIYGIEFVDNGNKILDANESSKINFTVGNKGNGKAVNLVAYVQDKNGVIGIKFPNEINIGNIEAGKELKIEVPVSGLMQIETGKTDFEIIVKESRGFDADPFRISVLTEKFKNPSITISDYKFSANEDGKIKLGSPVSLNFVIQNIGQGEAKNIDVTIENPENVFPANETNFKITNLQPNQSSSINYEFFTNKRYIGSEISINVVLTESYKKYGETKKLVVSLEQQLSKTQQINIDAKYDSQIQIEKISLTSDVDKNIPVNTIVDETKFALIIGNEDYKSFQQGISNEMNVEFASNDASIFKEYCIKTIGVPANNITYLLNGTAGKMNQAINKINSLIAATNGKANVIVYYAGHGLPDEKTKEPFLIPVDVSGNDISSAIKLSFLYSKLTEFPSKQITVFLDACFSGGGRELGLLAARGVKVVPRNDLIKGNIVVFTASSGEESSLPWKDKQHGLFTYFLLKNLQESHGDIMFSELYSTLKDKVGLESVRTNNKKQSPQVLFGIDSADDWGKLKLK